MMMDNEKDNFSILKIEEQKEYWCSLALRHCKGLGPRYASRLLKKFHGACFAINNRKLWKNLGIPEKIINEISAGNWQKEAEKEWNECFKLGMSFILWSNPFYPEALKELPDAPIFFYIKGNRDLLKNPGVAIVGSRKACHENLLIAEKLAFDLSSAGITVVSGMAMGIDASAHTGALKGIGSSIGILGTGINIVYPWSNRDLYKIMEKDGLLLSEFPPSSPPTANHFPVRNRIISGLTLGVVVVEAAERSGSLITAKTALEQNREVFAIPGPAFNTRSLGCQNLVRSGAHPVFSAEDIIYQLKPLLQENSVKINVPPKSENPVLPIIRQNNNESIVSHPGNEANFNGKEVVVDILERDDSERILECLKENGKMHIDKIGQLLAIEQNVLTPLLVGMEMMGQILRLPGGFYEII